MNSDPEKSNSLEITGDAKPSVPVYTCIVYVLKKENEDGANGSPIVSGRVANLDGIEAVGSSERFVLTKLTRDFKSKVMKMFEAGEEIPFVDPPHPPVDGEQVRSIPMHL